MNANKNKDELMQRAAAMSSRTPRQAAPAAESGGGAGAPRTNPVRVTSALEPQIYRQLTAFCAEAADATGAARVPHATVIRALIARLETDPALRATITEDVAAQLNDQ